MANEQQDRYTLEKRLGAGAMGEVWLASDTLLDRPVAIKYLKAHDDPRIKDMFLDEARMLARLNHPNITQIYDAVFDDIHNRFHIVMEFVEGQPLDDILDNWNGPLPLDIVLDVTIGVVEALADAHTKGIVHRDIKPSNVMLQKDGVQLTDFGIAGLASLLAEGSDYIVGTPAYISPEQIEGLPTDGRADLYSLGIMLYEMTSGGDRPFSYKSQTKLFMAHLEEPPPDLRHYSPDIPFALERAIMKLLAKQPEDRYATADDLLKDLRSIQARQQFSQPHLQLLAADTYPLVGRDTELEQLEALWEEVQRKAKPHLLILQGEMGSGKTRLITDFLGQVLVDQGLVALAGRCDEAGVPYAPFAEILGTGLQGNQLNISPSQTQIDDLLKQMPSLARILNVSDTQVETAATETPTKPQPASGGLWQKLTERVPEQNNRLSDSQWQFSKTVLDLLGEAGPIALFFEDATYIDEPSVGLLRFLVRQGQLPLLCIAACRTEPKATAWANGFTGWEKTVLELGPLSAEHTKGHLDDLLEGTVSDEVATLIYERSQGNPLQIDDLTRQLVERDEIQKDDQGVWHRSQKEQLADAFLPQSVLGAFQRRIKQLDDQSRDALALAAMLEPGPEFEMIQWGVLLQQELPDVSVQDALEHGLKKRLIRLVRNQRYTFHPPDVSRVLIATFTGTRRKRLHQDIAAMLEKIDSDPMLVAHHYEQAGEIDKAADFLEQAAERAQETAAASAALTYYNRAVTLVESPSALEAMGELYREQGEHDQAIDAYNQTLAMVRKSGNKAQEAQILNNLSLTHCLSDQYDLAQEHAERVLKLESASEASQAIAQSNLGLIMWLSGRLIDAEHWAQQAIKLIPQMDRQQELAEAYVRLGQIYTDAGKFNKARLALQQALKLSRELQDETGEAHTLNAMGRLVAERGDFDQGLSLCENAYQKFTNERVRSGLLATHINRGRIFQYKEASNKALAALSQASMLVDETGEHSAYALGDIYLITAQAHLQQGQLTEAKAATDKALRLVEAAGNRALIAQAQVTLAQIYTQQQDETEAEVMYKNAIDLFGKVGSQPGLLRTQHQYAHFLLATGQTDGGTILRDRVQKEARDLHLFLPKAGA